MGPGSMGANTLCRDVHIGLRQGQGPGSIVSYCASHNRSGENINNTGSTGSSSSLSS